MENIRKDFTQQFEQWSVSSFPQNSCFYPNSPNPPQLTQFIQLTPTHLREHLPRKKECFFSSITWIPTDPFLRSNYHPGIFRLNAVQRFAWGSIAPIWGMSRIGVGPGFDSQGSVNFFTKYCFPNLHCIHVKALEVQGQSPGLLTIQKSVNFKYEMIVRSVKTTFETAFHGM